MTKAANPFKEYPSSVVAHAIEVTDQHTIISIDESTAELHHYDESQGEQVIVFRHFDPVHIGDFIKQLNELDIYHCPRKQFLALHVVKDSPFKENAHRVIPTVGKKNHVSKFEV